MFTATPMNAKSIYTSAEFPAFIYLVVRVMRSECVRIIQRGCESRKLREESSAAISHSLEVYPDNNRSRSISRLPSAPRKSAYREASERARS